MLCKGWVGAEPYIVQNDQLLCPATIVRTDCVEDSIMVQLRYELLDEKGKEGTADECEVEVVDHEETVQRIRLSVLHQLSSAKYDYVVCRQGSHGFCQC